MGRQGTPRSDSSRSVVQHEASAYASAHRQRRRWQSVLSVLAAAVVFVTVYALTMPAATLTRDLAALPEGAQAPEGYTQIQTARDENNGFAVTVYAPEGAIPEGATLKADLIFEGTDAYAAAEQAVAASQPEAQSENGEKDYGFAALDIRFEDADGNEVEPTGDVYVSIDAAGLLPEDADPESVTVQHLAEDENGSVVSVDTVADASTESVGIVTAAVTEDTNTVQAAFSVDRFSTFTIVWNGGLRNPELEVQIIDTEGNQIAPLNLSIGETSEQKHAISIDDLVDMILAEDTNHTLSEYEFRFARVARDAQSAANAEEGNVERIQYVHQRQYSSQSTGNNKWQYLNNNNVYIVFERVVAPQGNFYISESIAENGLLTATFSDPGLVAGKTFNYVWYRKAPNSNDWVSIVRLDVSGEYENMSADNGTPESTSVNAVLDGYLADQNNINYLFDYKVEAYEVAEGAQQESPAYSAELQMPYYYAIQNGDFEKPNGAGSGEYRVNDSNEEIMWRTTESTGEIELVVKGEGAQKYYGLNDAAYEGHNDQIAELNAKEEESSLYQDIATVPGTRLYWSLDHRARNNTSETKDPYTDLSDIKQDTMYVLIMSSEEADELLDGYRGNTAQEKVRNYISDHPEALNEYIWEISDDASWGSHGGDYVIPENQFLTRFFFVAGDTVFSGLSESERDGYDSTAQVRSVGNFIDNVWFNKNVPPVSEKYGNLEITKTVTGVDYLPGNYTVEFSISQEGSETVQTEAISGSEFIPNGDGTYSATATIINLEPGSYEVKESSASPVDGYIQVGQLETCYTSVSKGDTSSVQFSNSYQAEAQEPIVSDPSIRKYVDAKDDGTFDLSLDVTGTAGKDVVPVNVLYILDESYSMMWDMDGSYPGKNNENPSGDNQYPEDGSQKPIEGSEPYEYSYVRFNAAKQAINRLNSTLGQDVNLDVEVAMVTFAQDNNNPDTYEGKTINWKKLEESGMQLPSSQWETFASGTNYADAFGRAQTLVESARSNAETVVVFVTDGEPNWPRSDDDGNYAKNQAVEQLSKLSCDRFYAVGVGTDVGNEYLAGLIGHVQNGVEADSFQSGDTTEIVGYFNQIAADIAGADTHNVTIVDELSEYAELIETTLIPTISVTDAAGNNVDVTQSSPTVEPNEGGVVTYTYTFNDKTNASSSGATQQTITYTYYPAGTYDNNQHPVITLVFPEDYALTRDWLYTITFKVQPSAEAIEYLQQNNNSYPNTGDEDTDVPGSNSDDWTSSFKTGFFSNASASLIFDSGNSEDLSKDYSKPVIQATTRPVSFVKVDPDGSILPGAEFVLSKPNPQSEGEVLYLSENGEWVTSKEDARSIPVDSTSATFELSLIVGQEYYLTETVAPEGYRLPEHELHITWSGNAPHIQVNTSGGQVITPNDAGRFPITNTTGTTLPNTGGSGTKLITFGGLALVVAAVCGYGLRRGRERGGSKS